MPTRPAENDLTVAIIDPSHARAAVLEEGLRAAGVERVIILPDGVDLAERLARLDPDVVVIELESPSRDVLEHMVQASRAAERPVALFVDCSDAALMQAAIEAGVSAYIVDGLKPGRVKAILDVAILRFNTFARLQRELAQARSELESRKTVDRAKGILMSAKNISEEEAYRLLRRAAMNEKKKIVEIAQAVITATDLLR